MPDVTVNTSLARIQTDPTGSDPIATAYFSKTTTIDGQDFAAPWTSVSWPLQSKKLVTLDGVEYPYHLASRLVTAIAYAEKAEADAAGATP